MNKIILMGRVTREPDIRYGGDNRAVARYCIAVDRRYKNANGEYPTDFFNLVSFGKTAEFVEKYINKGTKIVVEGELQNNNYEKDGKKIYQDQIVISNVEFAESKNSGSTEAVPQTDADGFNPVDGSVTEDSLPFV